MSIRPLLLLALRSIHLLYNCLADKILQSQRRFINAFYIWSNIKKICGHCSRLTTVSFLAYIFPFAHIILCLNKHNPRRHNSLRSVLLATYSVPLSLYDFFTVILKIGRILSTYCRRSMQSYYTLNDFATLQSKE